MLKKQNKTLFITSTRNWFIADIASYWTDKKRSNKIRILLIIIHCTWCSSARNLKTDCCPPWSVSLAWRPQPACTIVGCRLATSTRYSSNWPNYPAHRAACCRLVEFLLSTTLRDGSPVTFRFRCATSQAATKTAYWKSLCMKIKPVMFTLYTYNDFSAWARIRKKM